MDDLNELKKIWQSANTKGLPPASQMGQLVSHYRESRLIKIIAVIIIGSLSFAGIITIAFMDSANMLSTSIGEILMGAAALVLLGNNLRLFISFYKLKDCSNTDYLREMELIKQQQLFFFKRTQIIGFLLASVGTLLFMFEKVDFQTNDGVIEYGSFILYILLAWFVFRPKMMKRHTYKINEQIEKLKELEKQLNKDEQ